MLVDVVELRVLGVRRPRDDLRGAAPVRGILSLNSGRPGRFAGQANPPLLAGLTHAEHLAQWLLEPLDQAAVRVIRDGNLVVVGLQEVARRGRVVAVHRQAWWCRVVSGPAPRVGVGRPPHRAAGALVDCIAG